MITKIPETSYRYTYLKNKYPDQKEFYSDYVEGGYLDVSRVRFLGENKQYLEDDSSHQGSFA